jgi:hypothetical protein
MAGVPMREEYGPTLGQLLAPRWRAASPWMRRVAIAAAVALLVAIAAGVLTLLSASYSHGGRVPFSFSYRGLYRTAPDAGGYVKVARRRADGTIKDSFAVDPLQLPPYSGGLSGELPLYAAAYITTLSHRYQGFVLRGEGKTKVNNAPAYHVFYTATVEGRSMYGRDVFIVPERPGAREGVDIVMLTGVPRTSKLSSPIEVANKGILSGPLKSFSVG